MVYIVKLIYNTFLLPPGFIIILLLVGFFRLFKKHPRAARGFLTLTFVLYVTSMPLVGDNMVRILETRYTLPPQVTGDVIIMLGGGATLDTPNLHGSGHLSGSAANRFLTCLQLHNKLRIPIIICGGQVFESTGTEAEIAGNIFRGLGVPEDSIIVENRSLNTTQNAAYSKELVEMYGFKNPILVTSAFHMERSLRQFKKVNIAVTPYPTDYMTNIRYRFQLRDLLPAAEGLNKVSTALKEYIGILASGWY